MQNPYADDGVVYNVEGMSFKRVGKFYDSTLVDGPFWTIEVNTESGWAAINPAHIIEIRPANGVEMSLFEGPTR